MYNQELLANLGKNHAVFLSPSSGTEEKIEQIGNLNYPAWKRLKADASITALPDYKSFKNSTTIFGSQSGLSVSPLLKSEDLTDLFDGYKYGPSEIHRLSGEVFFNAGQLIQVGKGVHVAEPVVIKMQLDKENDFLMDRQIIIAEESASVTVVIDYRGQGVTGYHNGVINIMAKQNAKVKVVVLQNFNQTTHHILSSIALVERDALAEYSALDLGSDIVATDHSTYLLDENSQSDIRSIYMADGEQRLDIGYNTIHKGRRSQSELTVKGALLDKATKVFRGNLFFERGAKKSEGAEEEYVILLSDQVKADAIPALMCDEDDVQGEHAASAGQVDENKLFYLMSRGLSEREAKKLIILASFGPVIEGLPIEGLVNEVHEIVNDRLELRESLKISN